jgi:hypothetical protein
MIELELMKFWGCVGFVNKAMIAQATDGMLVQVIELYSQSESRQDRSHCNGGVCLCRLIGVDPSFQ